MEVDVVLIILIAVVMIFGALIVWKCVMRQIEKDYAWHRHFNQTIDDHNQRFEETMKRAERRGNWS